MSEMTKISRKKRENFTIIDNTILRDRRLSCKAKAIHITVMSLPPDWDFSISGLVELFKEGEAAVRTGIKELIEAGYCKYEKKRNERGQFFHSYEFQESPFPVNPDGDYPHGENPDMGKPDLENHNANKELNNKVLNNQELNTQTREREEAVCEDVNTFKSEKQTLANSDSQHEKGVVFCDDPFRLGVVVKQFLQAYDYKGGFISQGRITRLIREAIEQGWATPEKLIQKAEEYNNWFKASGRMHKHAPHNWLEEQFYNQEFTISEAVKAQQGEQPKKTTQAVRGYEKYVPPPMTGVKVPPEVKERMSKLTKGMSMEVAG